MFELNYSKINSYLFCNYLYKFIYIDGRYKKHNYKTSFGISLHRALKEFPQSQFDLKKLLYSYEENWCNYGYKSGQEMMDYYYKGIDILTRFYDYERSKGSKIIYSEDFFEVVLNDDFILRGTVDRVDLNDDGKVNVIDYKLGLDDDNYNKNNLQLSIYAFGISKKYSLKISKLIYYFLMSLKEVEVEYMGEDRLIDFVLNYGKKMKNAVLEKKGRCEICLARELCEYSDFVKRGV